MQRCIDHKALEGIENLDWPRVVNTARSNRTSVNAARANGFNAVKPSACWVWRPIKPNSASITLNRYNYIDARARSKSVMAWAHDGRHSLYSMDFKQLMEVMLPFGRRYGVLFVLNFKLPDENQILLKVPRKDNMYSFDMKNIVPKESLTCLVAKATLDESMLWHRRLGHINFKKINKLVKDKLVKSSKDVNVVVQKVNSASPDLNTGSLELNVVGPSLRRTSAIQTQLCLDISDIPHGKKALEQNGSSDLRKIKREL
ncbi:ribonuclease H-like domain-containing protein [Tanacetum coccineum]